MFSFLFDATFLTIVMPIVVYWYYATCFSNNDSPGVFGIVVSLFAIFTVLFWTGTNPLTWLYNLNWFAILWTYLIYFVIGGVYAIIIKWWLYVNKAAREIKSYMTRNSMSAIDACSRLGYGSYIPIQATHNKNRIYKWIAYWPFSLIYTIVGDLFINIVKTIYKMITNIMQSISSAAFKGM